MIWFQLNNASIIREIGISSYSAFVFCRSVDRSGFSVNAGRYFYSTNSKSKLSFKLELIK